MRPIVNLALMAAMAVGTSSASALAEEPKGDLAKLQGAWTAKVGPDKNIPITLAIKGNAIELTGTRPGGEEFKLTGELKIDEKASPKSFNWAKLTNRDGNELPENLGIYKLDGDSWTVCAGGPGNERPTKFEAGEGGPPNLLTWARVKEKADEKPDKGDLARFQGTWLAPAGANDEVVVTMTVKDNAYTARWDRGDGTKVELKGEIRINEKATPKTIDFFNSQRNDGDDARDNLGIYTFEGDAIRICVGGAGNERPTEFKRGDDGAPLLLIFTKKKG
jgi:uncharacterized protein (TIGR03067 family)